MVPEISRVGEIDVELEANALLDADSEGNELHQCTLVQVGDLDFVGARKNALLPVKNEFRERDEGFSRALILNELYLVFHTHLRLGLYLRTGLGVRVFDSVRILPRHIGVNRNSFHESNRGR
jgi:hypothetical protein